jgi:hypothetical protein
MGGQRVESQLDLPPGSFTNLRRHYTNTNEKKFIIDKISLDRRINGKKQNY